jgi:hypothetical protein
MFTKLSSIDIFSVPDKFQYILFANYQHLNFMFGLLPIAGMRRRRRRRRKRKRRRG